MKILQIFKKKDAQPAPAQEDAQPDLEAYAGMRVEVVSLQENLLFVAKMLALRGDRAELHQYSEASIFDIGKPEDAGEFEPMHVKIRGYSDYERKAVYLEGVIAPQGKNIWDVTELKVTRIANDRAFFRLDTAIEASITAVGRIGAGIAACTMLNISIGGACVSCKEVYNKNDKFLLNVRLLEDQEPSVMLCEVLRITERDGGKFEYGCRFLALSENDKERITQNIFAVQRQKRG